MKSVETSAYKIGSRTIHLKYGSANLPIQVNFSAKKHLSITVYPDRQIIVKAPQNLEENIIIQRIQKRAGWIVRQLDYYEKFHPVQPARQFIGGETHCYLGRQYRLKLRENTAEQVKLIGRYIEIQTLNTTDRKKIKQLLLKWYHVHAKELFRRRLDEIILRFNKLGISYPDIRVQRMDKRWGSCIGKKRILFNSELAKAPLHCIDYVIVHELCHMVHAKHDQGFYKLLSRMMPDWEKRKRRLEMVVI